MIESLRYILRADNQSRAAFREVTRDMRDVRGAVATIGQQVSRFGRGIRNFGGAITAGVTLPILGAVAGLDRSIASLEALQGRALGAGVMTGELVELEIAARRFGIEGDKVADILRDVNDRVGDFAQTGGGPLADFFENVAPLVGRTIEDLQGMSAIGALSTIVADMEAAGLSAQEMTFHMEALASDATLLLPVLRDNASELNRVREMAERLGLSIDDQLIASASEARQEFHAMRQILGIQLMQVMIEFAPILQDMAQGFVGVIDRVRGAVGWFSELDPAVQRTALSLAGIAAVVGPLVTGLGLVVMAAGALAAPIAAVVAAAAPFAGVIALIGAVAGGAYLIWRNWDDIRERLGEVWQTIRDTAAHHLGSLPEVFSEAWQGVVALIPEWVGEMVQAGRDLIAGLVRGIFDRGDTVGSAVRVQTQRGVQAARDELEIRSPSRVFHEIGGYMMQGLANGITEGGAGVRTNLRGELGELVDTAEEISPAFARVGDMAGRALSSILTGASSASDAIGRLLQQLGEMAINNGFRSLWGGLSGTGFGSVVSRIFGFAQGAPFQDGRVTAFARGGLVDRPTLFPMKTGTGLMGEAGAEAIMPLVRTSSGDLGVRAEGGGRPAATDQTITVRLLVPEGVTLDEVEGISAGVALEVVSEAELARVERERRA